MKTDRSCIETNRSNATGFPRNPGRSRGRGQKFCFSLGLMVLGIALFFSAGCGVFEEKVPPEIPEDAADKTVGKSVSPIFPTAWDFSGFQQALAQSLVLFHQKLPENRMFDFGPDQYPAAHMVRSLESLRDFLGTNPSVIHP
jgi:hypothetical protein